LKVDLIAQSGVVDAEAVLATNIHDEATHPSDVTVPTPTISDIDVSDEETVSSDFIVEETDDDGTVLVATATDDDTTQTIDNEEEA
jgi:hypothetical protein